MTRKAYRFLPDLAVAREWDLRLLEEFLPLAAETLKHRAEIEQEKRDASGRVSVGKDNLRFSSLMHGWEVRVQWVQDMLARMPAERLRAALLLFLRHERRIADESREFPEDVHWALRGIADAVIEGVFRAEDDYLNPAGFTDAERIAHACNVLAELLTEEVHQMWEYIQGFAKKTWNATQWETFDNPDGRETMRALCTQLVEGRLRFRADGSFLPDAGGDAIEKPLAFDRFGAIQGRGLILSALARDWIGVEEVERFTAKYPLFEPWGLMGWPRSRFAPASANLRAFVERQRQRFPAFVDEFLSASPGKIKHESVDLAYTLCNIPGMAVPNWTVSLSSAVGLLAVAKWLAGKGQLRSAGANDPGDIAVKRISVVCGFDDDEKAEDVLAQLQAFPLATLLALLPWSGVAQPLVLQAAGLGALEPLRQWLVKESGIDPRYVLTKGKDPLRNDPAPDVGAVDVAALRAALANAPGKAVKTLAEAFGKAGMMPGLDKILIAFAGEGDRAKLIAGAEKGQQPSIKLLGLLPVTDTDDLRERYLLLQRLYKEAAKHGSQRQATQRAAVRAGLSNLAQVAGYGDAGELEWVMESNEGPTVAAALAPQAVGDYRMWIAIDGLSADLGFDNAAGKQLSTVPQAIKREPALAALKERLAEVREQFRRFARILETRMIAGAPVTLEHLRAALTHPVLAPIVTNLAWRDEAGTVGLFRADGLEGPEGMGAMRGDALWLVHPVQILQAPGGSGNLARWQRWLVERETVQPFKQWFREIYVPTPAEQAAGEKSPRYDGRHIRTAIAQGLFQARDWINHGDEDGYWSHNFGDGLMVACHYDAGRYFTEYDEGHIREMGFERHGKPLALTEVPPIPFSEAMRDIDLVVTVGMADSSDESYEKLTSTEIMAVRADLLRALVPALGEGKLAFDERHVRVQGQRAAYRIHLGSGHVYMEPGAYLCIVPVSRSDVNKVKLPFADGDGKTAEIVSKVLLLTQDDKIKNPAILYQIERQGA